MKPPLFTSALLVVLLAGCGDKPSAATSAATASREVRGEPIVSKSAHTKGSEANGSMAGGASTAAAAASNDSPASSLATTTTATATTTVEVQAATALSGSSTGATATAFGTAGLRITPSAAAPPYSTNPLSSAAAAGEPAKSEGAAPGYPMVGFDKLSGYTIEISDELLGPVTNALAAAKAKTEALIPETVKAYSQKPVSLRGFMLPLKVEGGLVTEMLVMKDQSMCCYGTVPKIHEWVSVKMTEKGVKPVMDQPITLFGTLHVGEMRENGYLTGIYRMDGQGMLVPE